MSKYQPNVSKFKDSPREDLNIYELMLSLDFLPSYNHSDIINKREVPAFTVSYYKGNLYFWRIYANNGYQWTSANLIDGKYCNHIQYKNVNEFINQ